MKKFVVCAVAALCCLTMAVPVFAEIKMGGMITTDFFYYERSKESMAGGIPKVNPTAAQNAYDSWDTLRINMPDVFNRLWVRYLSDDKLIGGYIELRGGGSRGNTGLTESKFSWDNAYIDWNLNPQAFLRIGRQPSVFSSGTPNQLLGWVDEVGLNHGVLAGYGNIFNGASRDGILGEVKFNDMIKMQLMVIDPNTNPTGAASVAVPRVAAIGGNAIESNVLPRFDINFPIKVANFTIEPSATFLKKTLDQVNAGNDDSFTCWGASLYAMAAFGPFTVALNTPMARTCIRPVPWGLTQAAVLTAGRWPIFPLEPQSPRSRIRRSMLGG